MQQRCNHVSEVLRTVWFVTTSILLPAKLFFRSNSIISSVHAVSVAKSIIAVLGLEPNNIQHRSILKIFCGRYLTWSDIHNHSEMTIVFGGLSFCHCSNAMLGNGSILGDPQQLFIMFIIKRVFVEKNQ